MKYLKAVRPWLLLFLVISPAVASAGGGEYQFISPGIKLGYTFGQDGGFTIGGELSYAYWGDWAVYGLVMDIDFCKGITKLHVGGEIWRYVGIDIGPTLVFQEAKTALGLSVTPYWGAIIPYAYYTLTLVPSGSSYHEIGLYGKLPIPVGKSSFEFDM